MLHALSAHLARSGLVIAVAGTALTLATGQALAIGGWTIASGGGVTTSNAAIVWAVGESGTSGSFNPLVLHNG
ncbi:MAG: hypothetical protein ACLQB1_16725 [Streptosporangiaceae bacterium]